jgi:predicted ABC-type ATPase
MKVAEPKYIIIAGVNGSGKSTVYATEFYKYFKCANDKRINPDEEIIKFGGHYNNPSDQSRAGKIAIEKMNYFFLNRLSFNHETTLSGATERVRIQKAKDLGYKIVMFYIGLSNVEIAKDRIKARVEKGGHYIKDEIVERRYQKSLANLRMLAHLTDDLRIFDNTQELTEVYWKNNNQIVFDESQAISWLNGFSTYLN